MNSEDKCKDVSMVILAGGLSRRMGSDKADLDYHGQTFLENQINKGRELGIEDIVVSGYRGEKCDAMIVKDRYKEKGPLGGLEAALRQVKSRKCLVLSVDVPKVPVADLRELILKSQSDDCKVTVLQHNEKTEPLIGVYDVSLADEMEAEIVNGKGSVFALLRRVGYEVYLSEKDDDYFQNVNDKMAYTNLE